MPKRLPKPRMAADLYLAAIHEEVQGIRSDLRTLLRGTASSGGTVDVEPQPVKLEEPGPAKPEAVLDPVPGERTPTGSTADAASAVELSEPKPVPTASEPASGAAPPAGEPDPAVDPRTPPKTQAKTPPAAKKTPSKKPTPRPRRK
ncbi:hypothetical protein [Phytoactinopolyspora limicola]|uniref:hypothetical protein n=1 Tax=Phytoactinopolyspora limicola TaxID=2715536 RepID=UPI00140E6916|nr:hypothetical protein [Phytoactinopolyspora limicola]